MKYLFAYGTIGILAAVLMYRMFRAEIHIWLNRRFIRDMRIMADPEADERSSIEINRRILDTKDSE